MIINRKEAAELSPFIKAFGEGRIIEFSSITDVSKAWREVTDFPIGMIKNFKFRIKPEPKYRPFANAEECWAEMLKHQPFGVVKDKGGFYIPTLEGNMKANIGDYIIKGINGEFYPCKPDIFDKTYEKVTE